jgi:hypothetical protein
MYISFCFVEIINYVSVFTTNIKLNQSCAALCHKCLHWNIAHICLVKIYNIFMLLREYNK